MSNSDVSSGPGRLGRTALIVWVVVVIGLTARLLVAHERHPGVYPVFDRAGAHWLNGEELFQDTGFRYPPISAAAMVPFHLAGPLPGGLVWRWLNLAVFLGALAAALRFGLPDSLSPRRRAAFFLLLIPPSLSSLANGQPNGMMIGSMVLSGIAFARGRYRAAALLAVFPVWLKVYPVAFGMLLGLLQPRRFLPWFVGLIAVGAGLPFLLQDPAYVAEQYGSLVSVLSVEDRTQDPLDAYRDLRLVLSSLGAPISDGVFHAVQALGGALLAVACFLGQRRWGWTPRCVMGLAVGGVSCWMTVLGPATEKATYIVVVPLAAWLLVASRRDRLRGWFWWCVVGYALLVLTHAVTRVPADVRAAWPILRTLPTIGTMLLAVALAARVSAGAPAGGGCEGSPPGPGPR